MAEATVETALLNRFPGVREHVASLPEFQAWRKRLRVVNVDGELLHIIWGDQLKDLDQVIVTWTNEFRPELLKNSQDLGG